MDEYKQKEELQKKVFLLEKQLHDLEKDLIYDSLTSLKTRRFFEEESSVYFSAILNAEEKDKSDSKRRDWFGFKNLSILFFDIDHFKQINDTYGHLVGDMVLRDVAFAIKGSVREGDTVARWGGEEMVALLLGANETDAKTKAEEIREKIENLNFNSEPDLKVTISTGIANTNTNITLQEFLEKADKALYRAKNIGRNRVVAYSELGE